MNNNVKKFFLIILCFFLGQLKANSIIDFPTKIPLFYLSELISTISHEFGHAFVAKLNGMNPKIVIGECNKKELKRIKKNGSFITINSWKPDQGVTVSQPLSDQASDQSLIINKGIALLATGTVFGIISKILQFLLLKYYKNKISNSLYESFCNFLTARCIQEIIYGFSPMDQGDYGDGAKLFNLLHIKFENQTNFFDQATEFQSSFNAIKDKLIHFYLSYNIAYFLLKTFIKKDLAKNIDDKLNDVPCYNSAINYTKDQIAQHAGLIGNSINDIQKGNIKINWPAQLITQCLLF